MCSLEEVRHQPSWAMHCLHLTSVPQPWFLAEYLSSSSSSSLNPPENLGSTSHHSLLSIPAWMYSTLIHSQHPETTQSKHAEQLIHNHCYRSPLGSSNTLPFKYLIGQEQSKSSFFSGWVRFELQSSSGRCCDYYWLSTLQGRWLLN